MSNITVADLSAKHIGQKVIIHDGGENTYLGLIEDLGFETITESTIEGAYAVYVRSVDVQFPQARITFPLNAEVEIRS